MGKDLFRDLRRVAQTLDSIHGGEAYQQVCDELVASFDDPELTFSARILRSMLEEGLAAPVGSWPINIVRCCGKSRWKFYVKTILSLNVKLQ